MAAFDSTAGQAYFEATQSAADRGDPAARLQVIADLWRGGARKEARRALDAFLADYPQSAEGHLQLAIQTTEGSPTIRKETYQAAGKALALGLSGADRVALAYQLRGLYHLQRGEGEAAAKELTAALTPTVQYDPDKISPSRRAELHYLRSQAYRRQGRYDAAYAEIDLALAHARELGLEGLIQKYRDERELIDKHAGQAARPAERDVVG